MEPSHAIKIAVAILRNEQDELLTVRKKESTYYQLPGGKIEGEERPIDTLLRELKEELDLNLQEKDCQFLTVHEAQAVNEQGRTVRGYVFTCQLPTDSQYLEPNAELAEVKWVRKEQVKEVKLANLLKQIALPIWIGE